MNEQPKILVVDDEPLMRQMLSRALNRLGFSVQECASGAEALQVLDRLRGEALVVLDYAMPQANGAEVCMAIRKHADPNVAQVPIILLTAFDEERNEIECLQAGANDFVGKPVSIPVLRARIETHLRLAALRGQLQEQNRQLEEWRAVRERDLEAGRLVQQAIIPRQLPELEGWQLASHYEPLIQVGGDIYDGVRLPSGGLLVWIADATGHGVSAALMTTFTKLLFHHAIEAGAEPADLIERVNRDFQSVFEGHFFLTTACVVLQPGEGKIRAAGAGHPPILILRKGGEIDLLSSSAPPVGLLQPGQLTEKGARLNRGDSLLLFTDGVLSVTRSTGEHFSLGAFVKSLRGHPPGTPGELLERALAHARAFAAGNPFEDDVALVAMRWGE